ncbi:MAG: hypothetical protein ABRQ37_02645 [Candidatus Eremiobacterota bacterium]
MKNHNFSENKTGKRSAPLSYYIVTFAVSELWLLINYIPLVYNYIEEKNMPLIPVTVLLFLLVSVNVFYRKRYGIKPLEVVASVIITFILMFHSVSSMVSFKSVRNNGILAGCEANIYNIAGALENYKGDYNHYPPDLASLLNSGKKGTYLKELPQCGANKNYYWPLPYSKNSPFYGYILSDKADNYTIWCNGSGVHRWVHLPSDGCWPQYTPDKGLMLGTARK